MREEIIKLIDNSNIGSICMFIKSKNGPKHLEYVLKNIPEGLDDLSLSIKLHYLYNDIKEKQLCLCGKHLSYIGFRDGFRTSCGGKECYVKNRKKTCLEKYGVDNPKKSKEILDREQANIKEKWGGEHYMKNKEVVTKFKSTMLENHGVEWAQQSTELKEKSFESWKNNPNREEIIKKRVEVLINKSDDEKKEIDDKKRESIVESFGSYENFIEYRLDKIKESSMEKYGTDHHFKSSEVLKKRIDSYQFNRKENDIQKLPQHISYSNRMSNRRLELHCSKCNSNFEINRQYMDFRIKNNEDPCLNCNPIVHGISKSEKEVLSFIEENYTGEIISNRKIDSMELDIYLPDLNLGIEYNGVYWHSEIYKDNNYHLNKSNHFSDRGISVINIWEDDWLYKKDIVKSLLLNRLTKSTELIDGDFVVREIKNNSIVREFLEKNNLYGFIRSNIKLGLYHNNELVSMMTFGLTKNSVGKYELLRFCDKLNTNVINGSTILLEHFMNNYNPNSIISYCDISTGDKNIYLNLGFKEISRTKPNYYWVIDDIRIHRFNYRKDILVKEGYDKDKTEVQIMNELGHYRIFDCGSLKFEINI